MQKLLAGVATFALLSLGMLAVTAGPAAARIVCNDDGDCWHTDSGRYHDRSVRFDYHPDDWYFHRDWDRDHDHHWRGYHDGRGYWRHGVWITF